MITHQDMVSVMAELGITVGGRGPKVGEWDAVWGEHRGWVCTIPSSGLIRFGLSVFDRILVDVWVYDSCPAPLTDMSTVLLGGGKYLAILFWDDLLRIRLDLDHR